MRNSYQAILRQLKILNCKVYCNSGSGGGGLIGCGQRDVFLTIDGQASFVTSQGYTVGLIDVFYNGSKLTPDEYIATDGTTVTLNFATVGGEDPDVIEIDTYCEAPDGLGLIFQTNSVNNGSTSFLNLIQGDNIVLTEDGAGNVTIDSTASGSGGGSARFGYPGEDVLGLTDRFFETGDFGLDIIGGLYADNIWSDFFINRTKVSIYNQIDGDHFASFNVENGIPYVNVDNGIGSYKQFFVVSDITDRYIPLSVTDGSGTHYANSTGDIQIASGFLLSTGDASAATTAPLPTSTYNNGTAGVGATITADSLIALPAQDDVTLNIGDKLLVKDEVNQTRNGLFVVTNPGSAGVTAFILTRADGADTTSELYPEGVTVTGGTIFANRLFLQQTVNPTIGTDPIIYGTGIAIGALSLAPIGSSPNANAATITGNVLNLQPASTSFGGVVTTGAQSFAGVKTFAPTLTLVGAGTAAATVIGGSVADLTTSSILTGLNITTTYNAAGGPITGLQISAGVAPSVGSGYVSGTYTAVALTGGTGTGATATLTFVSGFLSSAVLVNRGTGYVVGDIVSFNTANVGGSATTVASMGVTQVGSFNNYAVVANNNLNINGIRAGRSSYDITSFGNTGKSTTVFGEGALSATPTTFGSWSNALSAFNSAFGKSAMRDNTLGSYNTAMGYNSMAANTTGNFNSAFGVQALQANTTGINNSAFGVNALLSNTGGQHNVAFGSCLGGNTTGNFNTAIGDSALGTNTGSNNVGAGYFAGSSIQTGTSNVFVGSSAGLYSKNNNNTLVGASAGSVTSIFGTGLNVAVGSSALSDLPQGEENTAVGTNALAALTDYAVSLNIVNGGSGYTGATIFSASPSVTTGGGTLIQASPVITAGVITGYNFVGNGGGHQYGPSPTMTVTDSGGGTGAVVNIVLNEIPRYNTALGAYTGQNMKGGRSNTLVGYKAGLGIVNGDYNTIIGANISALSSTLSNTVIIADGQGNQRFIANTTKTSLTKILHFVDVPTDYADNAAALAGSLVAGDVYRTGDTLKIVH